MKQHPSEAIELSKDGAPHSASNIEWWYCFSFLNGNKGSKYAIMVSFFRIGEFQHAKGHYLIYSLIDLKNQTHESRSLIDQRLLLHMVSLYLPIYLLLNPTYTKIWKLYKNLLKRQLPSPHSWMQHSSAINNPTKLIYGDSSLVFPSENQDRFHLHIAEKDTLLDLQFTRKKPPTLIKGSETPGNLRYYSFTRNLVTGSIEKNGKLENVTGDGWFDHQWGKSYSLLKGTGWNWFGLQLDDGRELLINQNHSLKTKKAFLPMANLIEKDGIHHLSRQVSIQPLRYWRSLQTNAKYPVEWEIKLPEFSITLQVNALFNQQEMPIVGPLQAIWEGACAITGEEILNIGNKRKISGKGIVELVGYASS